MAGQFDKEALAKCQDRLVKSKQALADCQKAPTDRAFLSGWAEFLMHTGSVLNALEAGAEISPQAKQWYGGVKRAGRNDPLVRYMHQARNHEEHATTPAAKIGPAAVGIGGGGETVHINLHLKNGGADFFRDPHNYQGGKWAWTPDGKAPGILLTPEGPQLTQVVYRGTNFNPPASHNGVRLQRNGPLDVGALYLTYLEGLVRDAENRS